MDTSADVGVLVHKLCGERAFILAEAPPSTKLLLEHVRCDVHGRPVHPGELSCPQCGAPIKIHRNDLDVLVAPKRLNGSPNAA